MSRAISSQDKGRSAETGNQPDWIDKVGLNHSRMQSSYIGGSQLSFSVNKGSPDDFKVIQPESGTKQYTTKAAKGFETGS